jgi:hypothetical protein
MRGCRKPTAPAPSRTLSKYEKADDQGLRQGRTIADLQELPDFVEIPVGRMDQVFQRDDFTYSKKRFL